MRTSEPARVCCSGAPIRRTPRPPARGSTLLIVVVSALACSPPSTAPSNDAGLRPGTAFLPTTGPVAAPAPHTSSSSVAPLAAVRGSPNPVTPQAAPEEQWRAVAIAAVSSTLSDVFNRAGLDSAVLDQVDTVFIERLDIYAHVQTGSTITLFFDGDDLVGVVFQPPHQVPPLVALYTRSPLDPPGFYDQDGFSLKGDLFARPLPISVITSSFGARLHPITGDISQHHGIDYAANQGTPVVALGAGVITAKGTAGTAGNYLKIDYPPRRQSTYLHLDAFAAGVAEGGAVTKGQVVGFVGTTGQSTGPHLHFELHQGAVPLDPRFVFPHPLAALTPTAIQSHKARVERVLKVHRSLHL